MRPFEITFPKLAFVAATRALGGIGIGLLLAGQMSPRQRRKVGLTLLSIGAVTTIPIAARVIAANRERLLAD